MENNQDLDKQLYLKELNKEQYLAATATHNQNVLVVAGAGTGKTKVLVSRYCYLTKYLEEDPDRIMAITFTKKAANEMKQRIQNLVGNDINILDSYISTFHSIMLKIIKDNYKHAGLTDKNFTILDERDRTNTLNYVIKNTPELATIKNKIDTVNSNNFYSDDIYKIENIKEIISLLKTNGLRAKDFLLINSLKEPQIYEDFKKLENDYKEQNIYFTNNTKNKIQQEIDLINAYNEEKQNKIKENFLKLKLFELNKNDKFTNFNQNQVLDIYEIYKAYEEHCIKENKIDFDEMPLRCYELLRKEPDILKHYQTRFKYILVDEFQDTNQLQYRWLSLLSTPNNYLFVVGDDDQNIYNFRGAAVKNLKLFQEQFAKENFIQLYQNYRSNNSILDVANSVISKNENRLIDKQLKSELNQKNKMNEYIFQDRTQQAEYIIKEIKYLIENNKANYKDFTILYRFNKDSQPFEEVLKDDNIPYNIVGRFKFYERTEIKEMLAYLKLMINIYNESSFEKVMNVPKMMYDENGNEIKNKRLGDRTLEKLNDIKFNQNLKSLFEASIEYLKKNKSDGLEYFINVIKNLHQEYSTFFKEEEKLKENNQIKLNKFINDKSQEYENLYGENFQNNLMAQTSFEKNITDFENKQKKEFCLNRLNNFSKLIDKLLLKSGLVYFYKKEYQKQLDNNDENIINREENLYELKRVLLDFLKDDFNYEKSLTESMNNFFDNVKIELMEDFDKNSINSNKIQLMTLHAAKGLEFKNVYILNLEEGIFPFKNYSNNINSISNSFLENNKNNIEESRRLFYVGITRARKNLSITRCIQKFIPTNPEYEDLNYNNNYYNIKPSPFLFEIPKEYKNLVDLTNTNNWKNNFQKISQNYEDLKFSNNDLKKNI